jgi:hypothetical protein
MSNPSRETQALLRFGEYAISQIPLNIIVGKLTVVQSGEDKGKEKILNSSMSYHKNYESALENLYDRMLIDKMSSSQPDMLRKLTKEIRSAKEEIILALHNNT